MKKYYVVLYSNSTYFEPFYSGSRNSIKHLIDNGGANECRVYNTDGYLVSWAKSSCDYSRDVWRCKVPELWEPAAQEYRIDIE